MKPKFITQEEQQQIIDAIKNAEKETSGEIRVHIQARCGSDPYKQAKKIFEKIGMTKTEQRNGVLFFIAYKSRQFAVLGDKGINEVVPDDFWDETVNTMTELFQKGKFTEAIVTGITIAGNALKKYFPYQRNDVNELSDEINYA